MFIVIVNVQLRYSVTGTFLMYIVFSKTITKPPSSSQHNIHANPSEVSQQSPQNTDPVPPSNTTHTHTWLRLGGAGRRSRLALFMLGCFKNQPAKNGDPSVHLRAKAWGVQQSEEEGGEEEEDSKISVSVAATACCYRNVTVA